LPSQSNRRGHSDDRRPRRYVRRDPPTKKLSAKHEAVALVYFADPEKHGGRAYRTVYPNTTARAAEVAFGRLLRSVAFSTRLAGLQAAASREAELDAAWALREAKQLFDSCRSFNVDDYLTARGQGERAIDLEASPELLARLTELQITSEPNERQRIRIKGPNKYSDGAAILALMARIGGWEAPRKIAPTNTAGQDMTLAELVLGSM